MQKADYKAIAAIILDLTRDNHAGINRVFANELVERLSDYMEKDNPTEFDRNLFYEECFWTGER